MLSLSSVFNLRVDDQRVRFGVGVFLHNLKLFGAFSIARPFPEISKIVFFFRLRTTALVTRKCLGYLEYTPADASLGPGWQVHCMDADACADGGELGLGLECQ